MSIDDDEAAWLRPICERYLKNVPASQRHLENQVGKDLVCTDRVPCANKKCTYRSHCACYYTESHWVIAGQPWRIEELCDVCYKKIECGRCKACNLATTERYLQLDASREMCTFCVRKAMDYDDRTRKDYHESLAHSKDAFLQDVAVLVQRTNRIETINELRKKILAST